jgi:hypothetical protein
MENIFSAAIATALTHALLAPEHYINTKIRFSDQDYSLRKMLQREGTTLW